MRVISLVYFCEGFLFVIFFLHRLGFMCARAFVVAGVPFAILLAADGLQLRPLELMTYLTLWSYLFLAVFPMIALKFIVMPRCPKCRTKMDREFIGSANYDCPECHHSVS